MQCDMLNVSQRLLCLWTPLHSASIWALGLAAAWAPWRGPAVRERVLSVARFSARRVCG